MSPLGLAEAAVGTRGLTAIRQTVKVYRRLAGANPAAHQPDLEAMGMESRQTQSSRDDGIDAIAVNQDPILGGPAIIQAKRYSKVVGYESVTALAGVMDHKRAAKGILVTTSWVGKARWARPGRLIRTSMVR